MTATTDTSSAAADIDEPTRLALFRSMLEMRHMEKRAYDLFLQNLVKGTSHLSLGPRGDRGRVRRGDARRTTTRSRPTAAMRTPSPAACPWPRSSPS